MTWLTVLLTLAGIVLVLGACFLTLRVEKKYNEKQFDERQIAEIHRSYQFSFWCSLIGQFAVILAAVFLLKKEEPDIDGVMTVLVGAFMLPVVASMTYRAIKGALIGKNESPAAGIVYVLICATQLFNAFENAGFTGVKHFPLVIAVCSFYIALLYFMAGLWMRK